MSYSEELYDLMELVYKQHGASNNGAQLTARDNHLKFMVNLFGEEKVKYMLINDFDSYHFHR